MQVILRSIGAWLLMAVVAGCAAKAPPPEGTAPSKSTDTQERPAAVPEKSSGTQEEPAAVPEKSSGTQEEPAAVPEKLSGTQKEPAAGPKESSNTPKKLAAGPKKSSGTQEKPMAGRPTPAGAEPPDRGDEKILLFRPESAETAQDDSRYTVVKVYYATDRSPLDVFEWQQSLRGGWPLLTGICATLTAVLMLWRPRRFALRGLAWLFLIATVILGGLTLVYRLQPTSADQAIERMYGNERGQLDLGTCEVSVPKDHHTGELESPTVLRLEFREDPERHVVLLGVHPEPVSQFYADLRACIEKTTRKEAFVFVHGYNVGFEEAVRRTAQIAYDLKFEGAPIVYSWPSQEGLLSYTIDETNVVWTVPHLKEFLCGVAKQSGATSVHLIAHSMGNRALTSALHELAMERKADGPRFHEVVLTAPDIDADVFRRDLAPALVATADRVTLYASSNDEALVASRAVHGYRRAGESGDELVVVPGVDTVDVSEVDTSLLGHSYYGSNSTVLADLFELVQGSKPPDQRRWLQTMRQGALKYWKFLRDQVADPPGEEL